MEEVLPVVVALFLLQSVAYVVVARDGVPEPWRIRIPRGAAATFVGLVLLRMPDLYAFDRVWAEAGSLYFRHAYEHGPLSALARPVSNYFDLSMNLASAIAVVAGLPNWPVVDAVLGLVPVLSLPLALPALGFKPDQRCGILLALAGCLYTVYSGESFGTVLHLKGWGTVYAFLVLLSLASGQPPRILHRILLLVIPITGPSASLLVIVFAAVVVPLRPAMPLPILAWTLPGLAVQIASALVAGGATGIDARPLTPLAIPYAADLLMERVPLGILRPETAFQPHQPHPVGIVTSTVAAALLITGAIGLYLCSRERRGIFLLVPVIVGHFVAVVAVAVGGAVMIHRDGPTRYIFPTLCMVAALAATARFAMRPLARTGLAIAVCGAVVIDWNTMRAVDALLAQRRNPPWRAQVADDAGGGAPLVLRTYPEWWTYTLPRCGRHWCGRNDGRR